MGLFLRLAERKRARSALADGAVATWMSARSEAHGYGFDRQYRAQSDGRPQTRLLGDSLIAAGSDEWRRCRPCPLPVDRVIEWAVVNRIEEIDRDPSRCRFAYLTLATPNSIWTGRINRIVFGGTPVEEVFRFLENLGRRAADRC